MILCRSPANAAAIAAALLLSSYAASLACAQGLTYHGEQSEPAGSISQEQMPSAPQHPRTNSVRRPNAAAPSRAARPTVSAAEAARAPAQCTERADVLGTSRTIKVGAPNGLEVGLKSYPRTLKLEDHEVVLTFDDGPLPETTGKVLDALNAQCVKATFFLIGQHAAANPQLVKREIREGHTVGHHTWSHPSITMRGLSDEAARADITKGIAADERAGYSDPAPADKPHVPFFRFPGFADTKPLLSWLASKNIAVFGADLWASDWLEMTPDAELKLIMSRLDEVKRGIILFHDSRPSTAAMLPHFLRELKERNYRVVHIEPSEQAPELQDAQPGWSSETEAILGRVMPKLLSRAKIESAHHKSQPARINQKASERLSEPSD